MISSPDHSTELVCLIGDPVAGSISPRIHNEAYREMGIDAVYLAFRVRVGELGDAVRGLRVIARGFNVTIPHKVSIMDHIDILDESAEIAGAVNTVTNRDGRLVGFNTDIDGVMLPLEGRLKGRDKAVILGAGGAARAALVALDRLGFRRVILINRSLDRAKRVVREVKVGCEVDAYGLCGSIISKVVPGSDLLINATPVGRDGRSSLLPRRVLEEGMVVFDMVYKPIETPLLSMARDAGAVAIYGYEMLVEQAARAIELIFGIVPPKDLMYEVARVGLEG